MRETDISEGEKVITAYANASEFEGLEKAGRIIRSGGLVAFPTETVYGLGANGLDQNAVSKIYLAKGRPSDNPLILHISSMEEIEPIAYLNEKAIMLAAHFWPGALTMILPKKDIVPSRVTGGLDTVAVRMPSNETAMAFIKEAGVPIAAPSANISGRPSPTTFEAVKENMDGRIDMIIDGGCCDIGIESTIVDLCGDVPTVLRPGGITLDMLTEVLPETVMDKGLYTPPKEDAIPKCPGMKYKHYAPKAQVIVFETNKKDEVAEYIEKYKDKKLAIYCRDGENYPCDNIKYWGNNAYDMAKNLFEDLRRFDLEKTDVILCVAPEMSCMGQSVRNRLYKSAGYNIVK